MESHLIVQAVVRPTSEYIAVGTIPRTAKNVINDCSSAAYVPVAEITPDYRVWMLRRFVVSASEHVRVSAVQKLITKWAV